ncbi:receptor kinase-like protein Xa21 [Coffea arabica]|uniref:non-specific serine/threonine protein kinase n=1 Tax=Coffea arabica TaxID=13443 RepID=A0A6P6SBD7_COFAR|nr:probable LRR receptor-like serine/threonine-protein kinase At3g47570 isoform X1 [Coffea arabica]
MSFRFQLSYVFLCYGLYFLNFVALIKPTTVSSSISSSNGTDEQALLAIKFQIESDPFQFLTSWNNSFHFCSWHGVRCNTMDQRVTALNLSSLEIGGALPTSIGNLTFLEELILDNNLFHGTIPRELSQLVHLQHISLYNNSFHGEIPGNLTYPAIRIINLERNNLEGEIPAELGSSKNLLELYLSNNQFKGTIPRSLGDLADLRVLSVSDNFLEGSIPEELGKLSNLEFLKLSSNKLSGVVPMQLFKISSIQYLNLASNHLNGIFPSDFGLNHSRLHTFVVAENQFFGSLPLSIANASGIVILDIGANALSGPIPMNIGNLKHLQRLDFSKNPLGSTDSTGLNFLTSLTNCTNLRILHLNANNHGGALSSSVANLSTKLTSLRLDKNYITGGIPDNLENLVNLDNLAMSQNMLTGRIPTFIGKLTRLEGLYLSGNKFIGEIPGSIGNITQLSVLEMRGNVLDGSIPVSLGNCTRLQGLDLSHNRLTGVIPEEVFGLSSLTYNLNLAHNLLSGPLPSVVAKLKNLGSLDISNNRLSGELPVSIGDCQFLEFLSLQGNVLNGQIPESLDGLMSIQLLDLSRNNFSGIIPQTLASPFHYILYLNLSFNFLEGEVPNEGLFHNSTAFSVVGNEKLCGGKKSLQLPECQGKISSPKNNAGFKPLSKRVLIPLCIGFLIFLMLAYIYFCHWWTRKMNISSPVTSDSSPGDQYPKLSYTELLQATDGFSPSNLIATGRYSSVYKGILKYREETVAVKVINLQQRGSRKSFVAECEALRNIRHRNILKIITSCSGTDSKGNEFKALVYEFMPNGSLESWLHPSSSNLQQPKKLNLIQRLNVAIDVATAFVYLHHCCELPVIHRDLKPSNILLDDQLCAHLGDFGSARSLLLAIDRSTHIRIRTRTIGLVGTLGYVALECGMGGPTSTLVDVYSYGILLLEMFTGKRPTDSMFKEDFCLHNYVKMALPDQVMRIADPKLSSECQNVSGMMANQTQTRSRGTYRFEKCLASILYIGVKCSAQSPRGRMDIAAALMELQAARDGFLIADEKTNKDD